MTVPTTAGLSSKGQPNGEGRPELYGPKSKDGEKTKEEAHTCPADTGPRPHGPPSPIA